VETLDCIFGKQSYVPFPLLADQSIIAVGEKPKKYYALRIIQIYDYLILLQSHGISLNYSIFWIAVVT